MISLEIEEILTGCGFGTTEAKLLGTLSSEEGMTPARLSKITGLKRPTIYASLDGLAAAGIVIKSKLRQGTQYSMVPAKELTRILRSRAKNSFEKTSQALTQLDGIFSTIKKAGLRNIGTFEIRSLETKALIVQQLIEAIESGDFVAIFNPQLIPENILKLSTFPFLKKTSVTQPAIREIAVDGRHARMYKGRIQNKNHLIKLLPKSTEIFSDIIMYKGNVVITHHDKGNELGLKIREERFYSSMRTVFELLWEKL